MLSTEPTSRRTSRRIAATAPVVASALTVLVMVLGALGQAAASAGTTSTTTTVPDSTTTTAPSSSTSTTTTSTTEIPGAGTPSPTDTTPTTADPSATSTSTSTSTTTSSTTTTTTTPPAPEHWSLAPTFDVPVDDSLASTQALLAQVVAAQSTLQAAHDQTAANLSAEQSRLTALRSQLSAIRSRRKTRAINLYVNHGVDINATLTVDDTRLWGLSVGRSLDDRDVSAERSLTGQISDLSSSVATAQSDLAAMQPTLDRYQDARTTLEDKISGATTPLGLVTVGPTDIARAAQDLQNQMVAFQRLFLAHDAAGALAAGDKRTAALRTLAGLIAGPTPGAYPTSLMNPSSTTTTTTTSPRRTTTTTTTTTVPGAPPATPSTSDQLVAAWSALDLRHMSVLLFALEQVGKPYIWATAGPSTYDCSGLTMRAWETAGVRLDHFSGSQTHAGPPVLPDQLQPGDLLTYGPDGDTHVTLYLGAGRVVEAKGQAYGVVVSDAHLSDLTRAVRVG